MQLERLEADVRGDAFDLGGFARQLVTRLIELDPDLTEKKQKIMIAWEHGHLTDRQAEDWIVLGGMIEA